MATIRGTVIAIYVSGCSGNGSGGGSGDGGGGGGSGGSGGGDLLFFLSSTTNAAVSLIFVTETPGCDLLTVGESVVAEVR